MPGVFSEARAFARVFMPSYVAQGFSSRMIQADLVTRFGKAYRMQNIQSDIRAFTGRGKKQAMVERADRSVLLPRQALVETELGQDYKYQVHANIDLYVVDTDTVVTKRVSFYDDFNRGVEGWTDEYLSRFADNYYETNTMIVRVEILEVDHFKGLPY